MKYDYPKEIQIGGLHYKIELVDGYCVEDSTDWEGSHHQTGETLQVALKSKSGIPKSIRSVNVILYHELLHAFNEIWQIGIEEKQIEQIAQGLLQVLEQLDIHFIKEG